MITLYGYPRTRSLRVSWLLEELGVDWQYHLVDFNKSEHRSSQFLALNPQGKVPCLIDGDTVVTESAAICFYLAERYGHHWLPEPGTAESATHHEWTSFIITELEQPLWSMGKHRFALPESIRLPEMLPVASWEFKKALQTAEARIPEQGYLFGHFPTVADILLAHTLNWAVKFDQKLPLKLEKYRQYVSRRPALSRALERETRALGNT
ncbi:MULTISPECIES: glutathione S-transferase family protein [Photobacterium]|uniref:Glutathione S-transferase n=1 Tax=Photobacterium ganghwense TaxID=320778 RepID=A0A0J1GVN2_9GAMM|nr:MULTISPECIES: glutathione S-transferase family protein [Photobacterium]KLV03753.1 glutathione S-transferase [Photobacterium ganghwense]PSU06669.1 glutathione S-transferase family protein [Photobacterium ganghwense]QSV14486.1 glutathione S-transferase family protein [Photobacterium ganghwense]